jgi:amino acid transporter
MGASKLKPAGPSELKGNLGPVAITAQAVATIGLTLTAVINIPQAFAVAGQATWIAYAFALIAIALVSETLVLFRHEPGQANGIAGYVSAGLGPQAGALATWALFLGYGSVMLACLMFFGFYLDAFAHRVGLPVPAFAAFLVGGLGCLALARRDVRLSTTTMLLTESISVLIVLGLCGVVLQHGGAPADLRALNPTGDRLNQIQGGLMIAVLSFIGFESAANLGQETKHPERTVPRAMRVAVLLAGGLFLLWAVVLSEGLAWLPASERLGLDPISLLADRLGQPGAGTWIKGGAFLCLFGTTLGSLTALGRVSFSLAQSGVLPKPLGAVHPRFHTPAAALAATALPLILVGCVLILQGVTASQAYNTLGGFSVLGFLLVYALVAISSLKRPLQGSSKRRRWLIGSGSLLAVTVVAVGYLSAIVGHQNGILISFGLLMLLGVVLVIAAKSANHPNPTP